MTSEQKEKVCSALIETLAFEDIIEDFIDRLSSILKPEDVFNADELNAWAEENGYKLSDSAD